MAAAARPGPSDARVPCPQCGGLIHPIAGRCKHCKADLAAYRSARPAAAVALPALAPAPQVHGPGKGGHVPAPVAPAASAPVAMREARHAERQDESQPILPPRPTGRMQRAEPRSLWKQWPVIVIVIAVLAIAAAIAILLWPDKTKDAPKTLPPPPAPERMDTNPLGPQGSVTPSPPPPADDPWSDHGGAAGGGAPAPAPAPVSPDPDIDPSDPLANPFGPGGGSPTAQTSFTILKHACARIVSCGNTDPLFRATCDGVTRMIPNGPAPTCAAAQRCIARLDSLDCDAALDVTNPSSVMMDIKDCLDAAWSC